MPHCDVIVGPGNRWVTAAKALVGGGVAGIDMLAGPSECLVLADATAQPRVGGGWRRSCSCSFMFVMCYHFAAHSR